MSKINKASCDCGAVSFEIRLDAPNVGICHCASCQKISSAFYASVTYKGEIEFNGNDYINTYNSSAWATRSFCKQCGSNLFYKLKETPEYHISAALFDDKSNFTLKTQMFTDIKPDYIVLNANTENMTRQECFDKWG
ncbi:MAG: GFA family protein [Rhizobiales bacterium]|nr:GFA family protein [Hyphomicrobiales bacterium]